MRRFRKGGYLIVGDDGHGHRVRIHSAQPDRPVAERIRTLVANGGDVDLPAFNDPFVVAWTRDSRSLTAHVIAGPDRDSFGGLRERALCGEGLYPDGYRATAMRLGSSPMFYPRCRTCVARLAETNP